MFRSDERRGDPKLEAVLARLCDRSESLWTTQAVKLPYLIDLVAQHVLGEPITRSHHKAWDMGVVTARAWGLMKQEKGGKHFRVEGDPYAEGYRLFVKKRPELDLSDTERAIVDFVLEEFGEWSTASLGKLTKDLNPDVSRWGGKKPVELSEAAYQRLPVWFGEDGADLEQARRNVAAAEERPETVTRGAEADSLLAAWGSS